MIESIPWVATAATVIAALMTASNLGPRITGAGFGVFLIGSLAWLADGVINGQSALIWTNAILTVLNIFGIWRWLGREAGVEKGARTAAEGSRRMPGDDLVPVSLFTRAKVTINGEGAGSCVDAMADSKTGRLCYVVVTDGGMAGVGETLRRLDWPDARIEGDEIRASIDGGAKALETIEREQWPAR